MTVNGIRLKKKKFPSVKPEVGQTMALHASPADRNFPVLISAFPDSANVLS